MKITEIVVSRSVNIKTRDYEGTQPFVSMKAEIHHEKGLPSESPAEVYRELSKAVNNAILHQAMESHQARGKKVTREEIAKRHGIPLK